MSYIIETKQPGPIKRDGSPLLVASGRPTAVATLDEARTAVYAIIRKNAIGQSGDAWHRAANQACTPAWPHVGGTIGPLPDGTVIEVRPIAFSSLGGMAGLRASDLPTDGEILAAFNAA